jgi:hypothetical protein
LGGRQKVIYMKHRFLILPALLAFVALFGLSFFLAFKALASLFSSMTSERFFLAAITAMNLPVELFNRHWKRPILNSDHLLRLSIVFSLILLLVLISIIVLVTAIGLLERWIPWVWNTLIPLAIVSSLFGVILGVIRLRSEAS